MAMAGMTETEHLTSRRLRRLALAIPGILILGSALAMAREPRFGLLATAIILGWTQLAGL